jgi:acyl transferase domain-containing protein
VNNDGGGKVSIAAPSVDGQAEVVALAQALAGVEPRTIGYVEAHGTGTALGDPVEVAGLTKAFRLGTQETGFCGIGSVKTNIGHADAAAGVAGLIKTVLALAHRQIPPTLNFESPNPLIPFEESPFFVTRDLSPWPSDGTPRRAGVSSLGVGGTNCHLVLEETPAAQPPAAAVDRPMHLLALSAAGAEALRDVARRYADYLTALPETPLGDFCFTANAGRAHFQHRHAIAAATPSELRDRLAAFAAGDAAPDQGQTPGRRPVAFLFTGQGATSPGMGGGLYLTHPVFRATIERCEAALGTSLGCSLATAIYGDPGGVLLERADYAQPALFALQVALAELWRSWGVEPDVVLGHSVGELAAACVAGVFTLEDGIRLVAERGRLMQALPEHGAMAVAFGTEERVGRAVAASGGGVSIAAVNGPDQVVVAGTRGAVARVLDLLRAEKVEARMLPVTHGFHSPLMDPMLADFARAAAAVRLAPPSVDFVSTMTGESATSELAEPEYWRDQIRRPVRFVDALRSLDRRGPALAVEIGPHPVLAGLVRLNGSEHIGLPSLRRDRPDWEVLLGSLGTLYTHGVAVNWRGFDAPYPRRRLHLPTYPFRRTRHWIDPAPASEPVSASLLGRRLSLPFSPEIRFQARISSASVPDLEDHRLFGTMIVAGSSSLALFLKAVEAAFGVHSCVLEEIIFLRPLIVPDSGARVTQIVMEPSRAGGEAYDLRLISRCDGPEAHQDQAWTVHVTASVRLTGDAVPAPVDPLSVPAAATEMEGETFYDRCWAPGSDTGPAFRRVERIWRWDREAVARASAPELAGSETFPLSPGLIEACFQTLFFGGEFETRELAEAGTVYVPFTIKRFAFHGGPLEQRGWCHARALESYAARAPAKRGDIRLWDAAWRPVAEITGFEVRQLHRAAVLPGSTGGRDLLYRIDWESRELGRIGPILEGPWMIVSSCPESAAGLATLLRERGASPRVADLQGLADGALDRLTAEDRLRGVVYLPGAGEDSAEACCVELLRLAQILASAQAPPRLWLVTRDTQPVLADDSLSSARHAALWGMGRVIARELPQLRLTCIDLPAGGGAPSALLAEITAGDESEVALRNGLRYVPRLVRHRPPGGAGSPPRFRDDVTYLITDGLSSQGQAVAAWLARSGARHLLLASSSTSAESAPGGPEDSGAQVRLVRIGALPPEDATARLREAWQVMPPLAGVFHLDLPMDDGVVTGQTPERLRRALAGAALGWALHEATTELPLDFFVCFSTSAALLGTPGQCTYAAAGGSMDALAEYRRRRGHPAVSINWGPWAEVGKAAVLSPDLQKRLLDQGWTPLATEPALAILALLLHSDTAHVGVLQLNWRAYVAAHSGAPSLLEGVAGRHERPSGGAAAADAAGESPDPTIRYLRQALAEVLGVPEADIRGGLTLLDLGLDSIGALVFSNRIRCDLRKEVSMATIIGAPTLESLATAITAP